MCTGKAGAAKGGRLWRCRWCPRLQRGATEHLPGPWGECWVLTRWQKAGGRGESEPWFYWDFLGKDKAGRVNILGWTGLNNSCGFQAKRVISCCLILRWFQFSSVAQPCPTLRNPMNHSTPGLPVHHQLPEFTQTHVHWVSDAIQPSHPLSSPSPPAPNPSQHQSLFQWVSSFPGFYSNVST